MGPGNQWLSLVIFACLTFLVKGNTPNSTKQHSDRRGKALNISKKPCSDPTGRKGICTFKWDCISQNGTLIGTCMDGFIFGTCCLYSKDAHFFLDDEETLYNDLFNDNTINNNQHKQHDHPFKTTLTKPTVKPTMAQPMLNIFKTTTPNPIVLQKPTKKPTKKPAIFSLTPTSPSPQLITWSAINPTQNQNQQKPIQLVPFPFAPGATYPQRYPVGVAFPVDPYHPNRPLHQYRPQYYGTYFIANNRITPQRRPVNFTVLNGADSQIQSRPQTSTPKTTEMTTVSVPIPQWTSPSTVGYIPVYTTINRLPLSTTSRPVVTELPTVSTTLKPHHSTGSETMSSTNTEKVVVQNNTQVKPQTNTYKKPILDYRKDCGVRALTPKARIVGGQSAHFGRWPWQVLVKEAAWLGLYHKNKCGGVLVSSKYALTAGHCQPGFLSSLIVLLGEYDLTADYETLKPEMRRVKRMIVHRHYNPQNFENDIAILELDPPVVFRPHISPICLPDKDENFENKMGYVTGWGKTAHGGAIPNLLQEVQVPIVSNNQCVDMFKAAGHVKTIKDTFLCAGYQTGGKDSCEGDSGGPLMVQRNDSRWALAGTVSHGIRCADPNLPGVYMRISAYRSWIDKIIAT